MQKNYLDTIENTALLSKIFPNCSKSFYGTFEKVWVVQGSHKVSEEHHAFGVQPVTSFSET